MGVQAKDVKTVCLKCMEDKAADQPCKDCGWPQPADRLSPVCLMPGTVLNGQYLIGRVLGQGGFGITYLGRDVNLGMKVAIKEFFPRELVTRETDTLGVAAYSGEPGEYFKYGLDRFLDEARVLARLSDHPGIVSILNFFRANGTGYLVMTYLPGRTFISYIESQGNRLRFETARNILMPVMDTLREVHRLGLLHRDISPENIYITLSGQVKLFDFGAARFAVGERSKSLSVVLKAGYAPMEQYSSRGHQGPWTDVYALGATLYRAVAGQVPEDAPSRLERDEMAPPSRLGVQISQQDESAMMRALAPRASQRFQDVGSFQAALLSVREIAPPQGRCRLCGADFRADTCRVCGAPFRGEATVGGPSYASLQRRIGAWFVDSFIVGFAWLIILLAMVAFLSVVGMTTDDAVVASLLLSTVPAGILAWLYHSTMERSRAQGSLGKMLMGIAVTDLNGQRISFLRATARHFAKAISLLVAGIGFLMPAFSIKKQALHDIVAGCLVVQRK